MMNQFVIVGRLTETPTIKETENNRKVANIKLAVQRSYKNSEVIYETDFLNIVLWSGVAENTTTYCKKGDVLGVKGRIQNHNNNIELIADRVSFLASKSKEE